MAELNKAKVFIEVSDKPVTSTVVRSGKAVPVAAVNAALSNDWVGRIVPEQPQDQAHVVSQSIVAGSVIPKGTVVDLVLAPVGEVPVFIFQGAHADLAQRTVYNLLASDALDEQVIEVLTKRPRPEEVSDEERRVVTAALQQLDIQLDEGDPTRNYAAGHATLRNALAFKV
ncbi:MAG: hypothetical protein KC620_24785, partial [Myxococcales bacterium]|nr:hypothetical protein [Myxococcales bacterium]